MYSRYKDWHRIHFSKRLPAGSVNMLSLFLKCILGAAVVLLISILSKSKAFYIAGLVPLSPTFALIAHVIVSQQQGAEALRKTALFGLLVDNLHKSKNIHY